MSEPLNDVASVPVQLVHGCLVASVQVELNDEILHTFQQELLQRLRSSRARAVILDLSGISILDSSDFNSVLRTLKMAELMSAVPVIVGLRAGVAASLVELGASTGGIASCLSLEQAFELLAKSPKAVNAHE
jgi:rsbT antagonist protein RsbS